MFQKNLYKKYVLAEENTTKEDDVLGPKPGSFVRAYRDRNGCWSNNKAGMRMSVAIRPQTVANLASKFDSIINETPASSSASPGKISDSSSSRQLKLRTYDISKIITELNKLNSDDTVNSKPSEHVNSDKVRGRNFAKSRGAGGENVINWPQSRRCDETLGRNTKQFSRVGETTVKTGTSDKSSASCGGVANILERNNVHSSLHDARTGKISEL